MKISKIRMDRLRNAKHFQLHSNFSELIAKTGAKTLKIETKFTDYLNKFNNLDDGLKKINKSSITADIEKADKARDDLWSGLVETNNGATKHFENNVVKAAERLKVVFDTYGNLAVLPFQEQTALIYNALQDLQGKYAEDVKIVGLDKWVVELKARNKAFNDLMNERYDETTAKSSVIVKRARVEIDKCYNLIVDIINVFAAIETDASVFEEFIKRWNSVIAKFGGKTSTYAQTSGNSGVSAGSTTEPTETPEEPKEPEDPFANAREWTRILKAGDFKLGDIFYIAEPNVPKKYYELIDEEHYNYFPNSDEGTLAWKRLV